MINIYIYENTLILSGDLKSIYKWPHSLRCTFFTTKNEIKVVIIKIRYMKILYNNLFTLSLAVKRGFLMIHRICFRIVHKS